MTTAQNIKELHDGGYTSQAIKMAECESIEVEFDEVETSYVFPDHSHCTCAYGELWIV